MNPPFGIDGLEELWRRTLGHPSVCIAMLDGPVDQSGEVFGPASIECRETLVPCRAGSGTSTRHGTQIASILFGRHGGPIEGIAPRCRGLILPIFADEPGARLQSCSQVDLARAILRAVDGKASIINISGGQPVPPGGAHPLLIDAIRTCQRRGIVVVAAAGNEGCECAHLPAALPGVLAVGALDRSGRPLASSNWGAAYRSGGIMAPGDSIDAAIPGGGVEVCSGTSYATAIVSGLIALLLSLRLELGRPTDALRIAATLLETAEGCRPLDGPELCRRSLAGRLDLGASVRALFAPAPTIRASSVRALEPDRSAVPGRLAGSDARPIVPSSAIRGVESPDVRAISHQPVYPIGRLSCELADPSGSNPLATTGRIVLDPERLARQAWPNSTIVWTLEVDSIPIYAIKVGGPHAFEVDRRLRQLFVEQAAEEFQRVAIPGRIEGERSLPTGSIVPGIRPELRGMGPWTTPAFGTGVAEEFLERVASGHRNLGIVSGDRALNFCGPLAGLEYAAALGRGMELEEITVSRCPFRAPGKDLWEVVLTFFKPTDREAGTRRVCLYTINVGDTLPTLERGPRVWATR